MNKLLETILLLLGLHQWSAQGDVDMFHTHICFELVCLTRMLLTMYLRLGLPRGRPRVVLMCSTPMYALQSVYVDWLLLTTPLFLGLPCSWSWVLTVHSIPMYAMRLTASMALVVDHAFLTRLALRSALCDDAFFHIRISYEPGGMFRLCSRQYSYCELALQPAATIPCICTFYFVSGVLCGP